MILTHLPPTFPKVTDPDSEDSDQLSEGVASYDSGFCDPVDEVEEAHSQIHNYSLCIEGASVKQSPSPEAVILKSCDSKDDLYSCCLALKNKIKAQDIELMHAYKEAEDAHTHMTVLGQQYTDVMNL